jgi:hypothetical protein
MGSATVSQEVRRRTAIDDDGQGRRPGSGPLATRQQSARPSHGWIITPLPWTRRRPGLPTDGRALEWQGARQVPCCSSCAVLQQLLRLLLTVPATQAPAPATWGARQVLRPAPPDPAARPTRPCRPPHPALRPAPPGPAARPTRPCGPPHPALRPAPPGPAARPTRPCGPPHPARRVATGCAALLPSEAFRH